MLEHKEKMLRNHFGRICVSLAMLTTLAGLGFVELFAVTPPCHAYSEASSEAGLEAPVNMRRRRGGRGYRRHYQQQNQQQSPQARQERMREAKERAQQQRQQHQQLKNGPQIRSYGAGRKHGRRAGFGNQTQGTQARAGHSALSAHRW